ncbi:nucleoside deaminase [Streptomyces sp. NPDC059740]|uniref:nucleoside deaminase n=1 Tax=Streptomyces sp. NPDC059740 TaxID=3346926 RepID=UPI003654433C
MTAPRPEHQPPSAAGRPACPSAPPATADAHGPADPLRDPWVEPMRWALAEAALATATGDVPVGAVVLSPSGEVIGTGHNRREAAGDPTAHAEVEALRAAAAHLRSSAPGADRGDGTWRLTGCTLVVTLEPCTMCAGACVLSRVDRVVYGAVDEKAGAVGSLWDVVRDRRLNHRPEVVTGVLAQESAALLREFFRGR